MTWQRRKALSISMFHPQLRFSSAIPHSPIIEMAKCFDSGPIRDGLRTGRTNATCFNLERDNNKSSVSPAGQSAVEEHRSYRFMATCPVDVAFGTENEVLVLEGETFPGWCYPYNRLISEHEPGCEKRLILSLPFRILGSPRLFFSYFVCVLFIKTRRRVISVKGSGM